LAKNGQKTAYSGGRLGNSHATDVTLQAGDTFCRCLAFTNPLFSSAFQLDSSPLCLHGKVYPRFTPQHSQIILKRTLVN